MSITLEIAPELEKQIQQAAAKVGLSPNAYILESITTRLHQTYQQPISATHLSSVEADLMQKINQSFSQIDWVRYRELIAQREMGTLTSEEQKELITLSDQLEEANAKRIKYVAELARLRNISLPLLMKQPGLKPASHA